MWDGKRLVECDRILSNYLAFIHFCRFCILCWFTFLTTTQRIYQQIKGHKKNWNQGWSIHESSLPINKFYGSAWYFDWCLHWSSVHSFIIPFRNCGEADQTHNYYNITCNNQLKLGLIFQTWWRSVLRFSEGISTTIIPGLSGERC